MRRIAAATMAVAAWVLTMGVVIQATPAEAESGSFQYLDRFESSSYSGNNGDHNFTGPWWENNDWGGHNNGFVTVESGGKCPTDRCAVIAGDEIPFWGTGLYRWADTAGAEVVKIRFKYAVDVDEGTTGYINVGVFDGAGWQSVHTIEMTDHLEDRGRSVFSETIVVSQYAHEDFMVGFFAHDYWEGSFLLDDVAVFGQWDSGETTTTSTTTTTIALPTTTVTTIVLPTTTIPAPTTTTTTNPPATTTTTTTNAPATTTSTTTTTLAPPTTTTTVDPGTTTGSPTTTLAALPPATTAPPTTIAAVVPQIPIEDDVRYNEKLALLNESISDEILAVPSAEEDIVAPGPVTQIMASITTTAITVRSHLLSAMALGLLIAVAAIWGLGKRQTPA